MISLEGVVITVRARRASARGWYACRVQWVSLVIVFSAAFTVGVLAHRSPKRDWEFISGWPGALLLALSLMTGAAEMTPRTVVDDWGVPRCEWVTGSDGLPKRECTQGQYRSRQVQDLTLGRFVGQTLVSMALDIPVEAAGGGLGLVASKSAGRRRIKDKNRSATM